MFILISRYFALMFAAIIIGFIFFENAPPFNITKHYNNNTAELSNLGPTSRLNFNNGESQQKDDLVYLTNKMPFKYEHANVKVSFKNLSSNDEILIGFRDQNSWHYNTQILDSPFMNKINWGKIGSGPYLYQNIQNYSSTKDFLSRPPKDKNIGIFDYDSSFLADTKVVLPDYKTATIDTDISVPLRGKTTLYIYLKNEPFRMSFTKRDLNWYPDPDTMKINVYKNKDKVFDATIDDDGNNTNNHHLGQAQSVVIKNPGPELPEDGIYKIVIDGGDSVLTNITTNLHKLVFEGPINPVSNALIYPGLVAKTQPTDVYTNATSLTVQTFHTQALQTLKAGTQSFKISKVTQDFPIKLAESSTPVKLTAPQSDVVINGIGYFAFTPDEFFTPNPYKILQINSAADLTQVDYVLTNYKAPSQKNGWLVAERQFDISDAVIQKGSLSWLISAPGLKDNKNTVEYRQIQMTLTKKGWFRH